MQEIIKRVINVVAVLLISIFMLWTINDFIDFNGTGMGFLGVFRIIFIGIIILSNVVNIVRLVKAIIDYSS